MNGVPRELAGEVTVEALVAELGAGERGVAVALDGEVVTRTSWGRTAVCEGDRVEVVQAVQGG